MDTVGGLSAAVLSIGTHLLSMRCDQIYAYEHRKVRPM